MTISVSNNPDGTFTVRCGSDNVVVPQVQVVNPEFRDFHRDPRANCPASYNINPRLVKYPRVEHQEMPRRIDTLRYDAFFRH